MTAQTAPVRLTRAAVRERDGRHLPAAPVRIVHLGLGAFHRAHQAWYTAMVDVENTWGIAAFTGRAPDGARVLHEQDGLFTLTLRGPIDDERMIIASIVRAVDGADIEAFRIAMAAPATAIVTLTITEPGYRLTADGDPDTSDGVVAADLVALRESAASGREPAVQSALARLVVGLDARRRAGAGPIAVVPCDNMPRNGELVRRGVLRFAAVLGPDAAEWISSHVSFVSTSVDRITPRKTEADVRRVGLESGWDDRAAVIAEPFANWVLCGEFPAGRPDWHRAGALFVDDIEPFERRKLWLLNGAHTLLATLGRLRGHETVAGASTDDTCVDAVRAFWGEAARHLPAADLDLDLDTYCDELLRRFRNPRIEHRLAQIAESSELKMRLRIVPVAHRERRAGRTADACAFAFAAWIAEGADAAEGARDRNASVPADVRSALARVDDALAGDDDFVAYVGQHVRRLTASDPTPEHSSPSRGGHGS